MAEDLTSAILLRPQRVEWATLELRRNRPELAAQAAFTPQWPEGVSDPAAPEAAPYLKTALKLPREGRITLALPTDQTLLRVIDMPTTDLEELRGMTELQVDKFSPFPSDQVYHSFEVLSQTADTTRVLIGAAPRDRIDPLGQALALAGVHPIRVDVDVLGWWRLLHDEGEIQSSGQHILLILDHGHADLIILRDQQPILFRSLTPRLDPDSTEDAREIAEELDYTLTSLEGAWGSPSSTHFTIWKREPLPSTLAEALRAAGLPAYSTKPLDKLPALAEGLARRDTDSKPALLDLSPPGWGLQRQAKAYQAIALKSGIVILLAWGILMGVILGLAAVQRRQLLAAQQEFNQLRDQRQEVLTLRDQIRALELYGDRTHSGLEILREISLLMPNGIDMTSFTYRKAGQVSIRGESDQSAPIYEFINRLEGSPLFTEVRTEGVSSQARGGQTRSIFRLTALLPGSESEGES
ncbi:MAG TPA: PilN domain-containing protein [Kiritimatiellia bacterium]|nr:PilN domain-containing protein [Kiritimatiellia bacterium]